MDYLSRIFLRYLIFVGIPYLLARRIEKFLMKRFDPETRSKLNDKLKKLDDHDLPNLSKSSKDALNNRGGFDVGIVAWVSKVIIADFATKTAIGCAIGATIWGDTADKAAGTLAKYAAAILSSPGNKFRKLFNKLKGIEHHEQDIQQIILDKQLTTSDKIELLKIKVEQALRELKGPRRIKFILFVLSALLFFFGGGTLFGPGNIVALSSLFERLRALLGGDTTEEDLKKALIEVYYEYNAPLPKELVPEEIQEVINSFK
jgi:hypothetical protein